MTPPDRTTPVLTVEDLRVGFGPDAPAIDGIGFALAPGRVLALVGESGSGKSVAAMAVLGLLPASARVSGSIRLSGRELLGAEPAVLREVRGRRIGAVFQEPTTAFDPVYPVGRQIAEAIRAHGARPRRRDLRRQVFDRLREAGLREPERIARSYPHELSGGQLQRAMIAMALSAEPVVLLADEPTTALDVIVQAGVLDLLRSLRDRGLAVLLITHDMGVVADLADDVVVVRAGRVVERGAVADVLGAPREEYTRLLLDSVPAPPEASTPTPTPAREHGAVVAELRSARVAYGRVTAVDGVDLVLHAGEVVGLAGESGSGKSTIGRVLAGLAPLSGGRAAIDGVDLRAARAADRRAVQRRLGVVFQDPVSSLDPRDTVGRSIQEPLRLHTSMPRAARADRVRELLAAVRLPAAVAHRYPHELSGGQRQRVAIARALALEPRLLIADEPTSALDVTVQAAVLDLLQSLQRRLGFACLFISHDLAVVHRLADTVVVLREGRVVEQGPAAAVLADPRDPYTRRLLDAVPVADPVLQAARREARTVAAAS